MPRVKPSERTKQLARFDGLLRTGMMQTGLSISEFCDRLGINKSTYYIKRRDPYTWRLCDIRKMSRIIGISEGELLGTLMNTVYEGR